MFKQISIAVTSLFLCAGLAQAASHTGAAPAKTGQQTKMGDCNKSAGDMKGAERKAHMKTCLSTKPAGAMAKGSQQTKMKTCNVDAKAKSLKGAERKAFMSSCLKG